MWIEITHKTLNDNSKMSIIEKMCSIQKEMNESYFEIINPEYIKKTLENKRHLNIFLFFYEDENYQINIMTKINGKGELKLITTAVGRYLNIEKAVEIGHKKLIELMNGLNKKYIYATYSDKNYPKGDLFFKLFGSNIGIQNGFKTSESIFVDNYWKWEATL